MKALIIIDMQIGLFTEASPRFDAVNVIDRINKLSKIFSSNNDKVIFIQHNGLKGDIFEPDTEGWKFLPEIVRHEGDIVVHKTICDAFFKTELDPFLRNNNINEIIITGCATDFCVDTTIRSAVSKNYNVTVVSDAHTTADRPHFKADQIIEHHNWVWENLITPLKPVKVISFEDLIKGLLP
jgi:nicotinamidase-related amidase